jgi:16S rRNA (uracil1498-N3)-methyltransferase
VREARIYVPPEAISGGHAVIKGDQARHLVSVLRKKPGDDVVLFDGEGTEYDAKVERIDRNVVAATVRGKRVRCHATRPAVALFCAVPKGRRFDLIVEHATELGADTIIPLMTDRTVVRMEAGSVDNKIERWRRIAVAAAEQCRRATLPRVMPPVSFSAALEQLPESAFSIQARSVWQHPPIQEVLEQLGPAHKDVLIFIGPEGGFTPEEAARAEDAGLRFASLGENILRTETAAIASLAVINCTLDRCFSASASTGSPAD